MEIEKIIARMKAEGKSEAAIEAYLRSEGYTPDEAPPVPNIAGGIRTLTTAIPLIGPSISATGRAIGEGISFREAGERDRADVAEFAKRNPRTAFALSVAPTLVPAGRVMRGGQLLVSKIAPRLSSAVAKKLGAVIGGGTIAGAIRAGDVSDESLADRATGTALHTGVGMGVSVLAPWLLSKPLIRTGIGALAGGAVAPEGAGWTAGGALAGGAVAASPSATTQILADATRRVLPKLSRLGENISQATGMRGAINEQAEAQDQLARTLGGRYGESNVGAKILTAEQAAAKAASAKSYGIAEQEGNQAWNAYHAQRKGAITENTRRAMLALQEEADDAVRAATADAADVAGAQNLLAAQNAPQPHPSVGEALEALRQRAAEVVRRRGPELPVSPSVMAGANRLQGDPTIATVANHLRQLKQFEGMAADDPRFLDAMYKVLGDTKGTLGARMEAASGIKALNMSRFDKTEIQRAQNSILDVYDDIAPAYREAVTERAGAESWMRWFQKGYDGAGAAPTSGKQLVKKGATAIEASILALPASERAAAQQAVREGARSRLRDAIGSFQPEHGARALTTGKGVFSSAPDALETRALADVPGLEEALTRVSGMPPASAADFPLIGSWKARIAESLLARNPDYLSEPGAAKMFRELLNPKNLIQGDPNAAARTLRQYNRGKGALDALTTTAVGATAAATGRARVRK